MALRNQGQLTPFACYLVGKIGNFAVDFTEIISAKKNLSNCSKHLVTPVNWQEKKMTNYLISSFGSVLPKLKTAFYRSHFGHCAVFRILGIYNFDANSTRFLDPIVKIKYCHTPPIFAFRKDLANTPYIHKYLVSIIFCSFTLKYFQHSKCTYYFSFIITARFGSTIHWIVSNHWLTS